MLVKISQLDELSPSPRDGVIASCRADGSATNQLCTCVCDICSAAETWLMFAARELAKESTTLSWWLSFLSSWSYNSSPWEHLVFSLGRPEAFGQTMCLQWHVMCVCCMEESILKTL